MKLSIQNIRLITLVVGTVCLLLLSLFLPTGDAMWAFLHLLVVLRILRLDIEKMLISDLDVMLIAIIGFGYTLFEIVITNHPAMDALYRFVGIVITIIGLAIFFILIAKIFYEIRKIEGIGSGDIKLIAASGAWLPVVNVLQSIGLAAFFALLTFGIWRLCVPGKPINSPVPLGAFLAPSVWLVWLILRVHPAS